MAEPKTKPTLQSPAQFLAGIKNPQKRTDAEVLCRLMAEVTGEQPVMWGASIIGFGNYHYKYSSGREGDWLATGLSPRAQNLSVYIMDGFDKYEELLAKLGPHSTGKACLYIKRLADIDMNVLRGLITRSMRHMQQSYQSNT